MATISNSSPLILYAYARIGRLELLRQVFTELLVPAAVYDEVTVKGVGRPGAAAVAAAGWIRPQAVLNRQTVDALQGELDPGEAEVIALAAEIHGQVTAILDDRIGRRLAHERHIEMLGSAGVLLVAKQRGVISLVRPILDELRAAGLRLGEQAYRRVLSDAGE
ncbi:MAG TPA: DUF3368 domain-containing protein [Chloroflexota bacterium]